MIHFLFIFFLLRDFYFCGVIKNKIKQRMKTSTSTSLENKNSSMPDWLFVFWAGGTALLSYSLVYALRKPFTAAEFEGLYVCGMDYKIAVSIIQLLGYVCAKLLGIKLLLSAKSQ
jgi:hypothetical protein